MRQRGNGHLGASRLSGDGPRDRPAALGDQNGARQPALRPRAAPELAEEAGYGQSSGRGTLSRSAGAMVRGRLARLGASDGQPHPVGHRLPSQASPRPSAVAKMTTEDIDDFYGHLLRAAVGGQPLAPGTVARVHGVLHRALAQAVRWEWIWLNPARYRQPTTGAPGGDPSAESRAGGDAARHGPRRGGPGAVLLPETRGIDRRAAQPAPRAAVGRHRLGAWCGRLHPSARRRPERAGAWPDEDPPHLSGRARSTAPSTILHAHRSLAEARAGDGGGPCQRDAFVFSDAPDGASAVAAELGHEASSSRPPPSAGLPHLPAARPPSLHGDADARGRRTHRDRFPAASATPGRPRR